ncbi:MAG: Ion transport protein [Gammaproteobacteria bacterium]|nr:MAG: Ion transport protein [Gammaproteobacteria bacterium]
MTRRQKVATILDDNNKHWLSRLVNGVIISAIIITVISIMLESVPSLIKNFSPTFYMIEAISIVIFTVEYLLRIWSAPDRTSFLGNTPTKARLKYISSPMAIIDLLAILPVILSFFSLDLRFLRVVRLLRILKLTRYSSAMNTLIKVIKRESRAFFSVIFMLIIILIISSSFIYLVERDVQPEAFGSIPQSMWWTMVTLSTVGYGDAVPITPLGKILGGFIMLVGIGIVALPAGILASAFSEQLHQNKRGYRVAVRSALRNGIITPDEYASLQALQAKYDLSAEDANEIIHSQFHQMESKNKDPQICPHCGENINEE